jgi:SAM-dependent methyltransferase
MSNAFWKGLSDRYAKQDWAKTPSIFAQQIHKYFPNMSPELLELGCGQGQDGLWFAENIDKIGVLATDIEPSALDNARAEAKQRSIPPEVIDFEKLDLTEPFRYEDETFDIVYSHLALHYFDEVTTKNIFSEIHRVLDDGGILAFLVNSVNDPEYHTGTKIEDDYFETEGTKKRYFSAETAHEFAKDFEVILCDENGETYKDQAKGVHNLVRFVGRKV